MVDRLFVRVKAMAYLPNAAGTPMWVEWRPRDEDDADALPLYPDDLGKQLPLG